MDADSSIEIEERIASEVREGLAALAPHLRRWAHDHLIRPRRVRLATEHDGGAFKTFWLVTDHVGKDDSSCRVVYDESERAFGLETTLDTGVEWYMGSYGAFSEAVENM